MSFLHVLGTIGKDIGKVALGVAGSGLVPGPAGIALSAISSVVSSELTGASGPEKKSAATAVVNVATSNVQVENKVQIISDMLEAVVTFLNSLAKLFPPPAAPTQPNVKG